MAERKPEIRFKGFNDDWEQRKLEDINDVRDGTHNSPQYYMEGHPFVTSKNVKDGFINYADIQYISDVDFIEINRRSKVDKNDILMGMIGTIGNIALVREEPDFAIKNVALIKDIKSIYYLYLYHYLQSPNILNQLSEGMDGGTQKFIALNRIRGLQVIVPSEEEQRKVGKYLENLDNLITLHQRKYDKLLNIKKSMLEKMFPKNGADVPEIRFKGFTDAWEQRKLGEVLTERWESIELKDEQSYQLVTVKRRNGGVVSRGFLKGKDILVKNYYVLKSGDYLISKRQVVHGANGLVPENLDNAIVSNEYYIVVSNKMITAEFMTLISILPEMYKKFFISSYGVDIEKLFFDVEDWKKRTFTIPTLEEQKRITSLFNQLDNLITLHQRELFWQ